MRLASEKVSPAGHSNRPFMNVPLACQCSNHCIFYYCSGGGGGGGGGPRGRGRGRGRGGRGRGAKAPVPTADELDAELDAYKTVCAIDLLLRCSSQFHSFLQSVTSMET